MHLPRKRAPYVATWNIMIFQFPLCNASVNISASWKYISFNLRVLLHLALFIFIEHTFEANKKNTQMRRFGARNLSEHVPTDVTCPMTHAENKLDRNVYIHIHCLLYVFITMFGITIIHPRYTSTFTLYKQVHTNTNLIISNAAECEQFLLYKQAAIWFSNLLSNSNECRNR